MTFVTLRILDGMERGKSYVRLALPITIGRESDSDIQLNDDRISRAHAKLQDHSGRVILTDLGSTNGTRVNGHPIQMRVMQHGDIILVGRCVLLFDQSPSDEPLTDLGLPRPTVVGSAEKSNLDDSDLEVSFDPDPAIDADATPLFPLGRPPVPAELNALQRVQLSDLLSYVHEQLGVVIRGAVEDLHGSQTRTIKVDWPTWSRLSSLMGEVSQDMRSICDPDD
jgi:predicted component of type VI protein secretion system